ncbi:nitroreductase family protein [Pelomyxa schiedti]|nr:nitroreductase family protein [Pelomyxa schiedti]
MDAITAIKTRRSIRGFQPQPVDKGLVEEVLNCGIMAPSAMGRNPWKFYIVSNSDVRNTILQRTGKNQWGAPVLVFTTLVNPFPGYNEYDCAVCHQNMMVAAQSLGLGSLILSYNYPTNQLPAVKDILQIPDGEALMTECIALGYAAKTPPQPSRSLNAQWME